MFHVRGYALSMICVAGPEWVETIASAVEGEPISTATGTLVSVVDLLEGGVCEGEVEAVIVFVGFGELAERGLGDCDAVDEYMDFTGGLGPPDGFCLMDRVSMKSALYWFAEFVDTMQRRPLVLVFVPDECFERREEEAEDIGAWCRKEDFVLERIGAKWLFAGGEPDGRWLSGVSNRIVSEFEKYSL